MDRALAFGCHPDDVECCCSGTLAQQGYEIHLAGGELGPPIMKRQALRERRLGENKRVANIIGAKFHDGGGHDFEVQYDAE